MAPVPVHRVQRIHGHRTLRAAPATHIHVGQRRLDESLGGAGPAHLDELPAPCREEHDASVGQIARIEVVVLAVGKLTDLRAVHVHLEYVIERVLRHIGLVELVFLSGQAGIVAAPGKEDPRCVVGQHGPQEASGFGEGGGEALEGRRAALEVPEQVEAAPGPRPPAVVLVGHVVVAAGHALGEQDHVEIQQRVGERETPLKPTRLQVGIFRGQGLRLRDNVLDGEARHVHAVLAKLGSQAEAPGEDLGDPLGPVGGRHGTAVRAPARRAALARGSVQREVDVRRCLAEDLHLVQVQELLARELDPQ